MMQVNWTATLRCPKCQARGLTINSISNAGDILPQQGHAVCENCGAHLPIREHVLDLSQRNDKAWLTIAGVSNRLPLAPQIYETVWRSRSLTLLSGEDFPAERELGLVNEWLQAKPRELIVDLGSSTDWYARGVAKTTKAWGADAPVIVAIDMAAGMLKAGRAYAQRDGVSTIAHVLAPAERLPFQDATVDALVCGGSLNEFRSMDAVLREARRVGVPSGRMVTMSLLAAKSFGGKLGQWGARLSGIRFPRLDEFNATIRAAGWQCERQQVFGAVVFSLLRPVKSTQARMPEPRRNR